ncbi:hypothetical protein ACFPTO_11670 [Paraburkholderia denitrificans]|uniref:Uncharacterized protein n=1 Tax=Paraburkholderia denitrificans TaxID=694025 RepID=A0ABW0J8R1_9BURK
MPGSGQSSEKRSSLRIGAFPSGPEYWRIDWFGQIAFPNRMVRRSQPSVLVHLSRLFDATVLDDHALLLSARSTLPVERQVKRWVSVGTMVTLGVGDIWSGQALVASPVYESETFLQLLIDDATTSMVKAGGPHEDGSYLLPFGSHPWHAANTRSNCVRVALPDGRAIIIPCMELIRFYFGSSSALLARLFTPPLTKDVLFTDCRLTVSRVMKLVLAAGIPHASASDVARMAGDPIAWRAAAWVGTSCLRDSTVGEAIYPQMGFPFWGVTDLSATGKWLPGPGGNRQTFLVYQLRSCSHPFPFRVLNYQLHAETKRKSAGANQNPAAAVESLEGHRSRSHKPSEQTLVEHDPSRVLSSHEHKLAQRRLFTDLQGKSIWRSCDLPLAVQAKMRTMSAAVDGVAVGEQVSSAAVRAVSLVEASASSYKEPPDFLASIVRALKSLSDVATIVQTASDDDGWTVPMDVMVDSDGVIEEKWFINDRTRCRVRRMAVFKVSRHEISGHLVILDAIPPIMLAYPGSHFIDDRYVLDQVYEAFEYFSSGTSYGEVNYTDLGELVAREVYLLLGCDD